MGESGDPWLAGGKRCAGRYRIEARLGAGGMGVVYRAHDEQLDRPVALKRALEAAGWSPERFTREARMAARIEHENAVRIYDFGVDEGHTPYLVMELLHGASLKEVIAGGPMPWRESVDLVLQIASGLAAAHALDIVHRDLKPANVFLVDEGGPLPLVKLVDFGLAKDLSADGGLSRSGALLGTSAYLTPEQLRGEPVTAAADLHALGVLWIELVTGTNPFTGPTEHQTHERVLAARRADIVASLPQEIAPLVERLVATDPALRGTSAELVDELSALAATAPSQGPTPPQPGETRRVARPAPRKEARGARPAGALWRAVLTALIAGAILVAVWSFASSSPTRAEDAEPAAATSGALAPLGPLPHAPPDDVVAVGRALFEEPSLSVDGHISCATCHPLASGGTTHEAQSHLGANHQATAWNVPSIWNASTAYRWSWRADATEPEIIIRALTSPTVMGNAAVDEKLLARLPASFHREFDAAGLPWTRDGLTTALGAYLEVVTPRNAPADTYFSLPPGRSRDEAIGALAQRGAALFQSYGCIACHQGRGVGGNMVARFGVMVDDPYADRGQCADGSYCRSDDDCRVSGGGTCKGPSVVRREDNGIPPAHEGDPPTYLFRVPSLRNVALTDPYFHDGSARTLREAILTMARLQLGRELSEADERDIEAFLQTLSGDWVSWPENKALDVWMKQHRGSAP